MMTRTSWLAIGVAMAMVACKDGGGGSDPSSPSGSTPPGADAPAPIVNHCETSTSAPVTHQGENITNDTTWAAGTHIVKGRVGIGNGAKLTIAPCAVIRMQVDASILVSGPLGPNTGSLVAEGVDGQPIQFVTDDPSKPWSNLEVREGGMLRLAYAIIEGGGSGNGPWSDATIRVSGDQYSPPQEVISVSHVELHDSLNYGVYMDGHGKFTADSEALVVSGAKKYPIALAASSLQDLPRGTYTGNGIDAIGIRGGGGYETIGWDTTMRNLGVPYEVGTGQTNEPVLLVSAGKKGELAKLTIEPGVHVLFHKGGWFEIEHYSGTDPATAALVAVGTEADPIVISSAEPSPAAGDWVGIQFGMVPSPLNRLDNVHVEYAGGTNGTENFNCSNPSRDEAAIIILGPPSGQFITNTWITNSKRYGIDRGWDGADIDFMSTNHFEDVASCKQSYPHDIHHGCIQNPPCP